MSVKLESASRLSALKSKIDTATGVSSSTLSEAVDNAIEKGAAASGKTVHKGEFYVSDYSTSSLYLGIDLNEDDVFFMTQFGDEYTVPEQEGAFTRVVMRYANGSQITGYYDSTPDASVSYPVWKTSESDPYYNVTYNGQYVNLKFGLSYGHIVRWVLIQ